MHKSDLARNPGFHVVDVPVLDRSDVAYPKIEGLEKLDWNWTKLELTSTLKDLSDGGLVIAHSLGGAAVLKLLSEQPDAAKNGGLFLVATP